MNIKLTVALIFVFASSAFAATNVIKIAPLEKSKPEYKQAEKLSLSGDLRTVPMGGMVITLQSTNYGQVTLFSPYSASDEIQATLSKIEEARTTVTVTGTVLTMCSASQLREGLVGCRMFDLTKPISIKPW